MIMGVNMIHLVTFLIAHSNSTMDKMVAFIDNIGGALYSNQHISEHLKDLQITRKKASMEAYQALDEGVQLRVYTFWNYPTPLGIFQVPLFRLIDFDEFGVTLERCSRTCGWALKVFHVRKDGHYKHGRGKLPSFLLSSLEIRPCHQTSAEVSHVLDVGFAASGQRGHRRTYSVIFARLFVQISRQMSLMGWMIIVFFCGIIFWYITRLTCTRL